MSSSTTKPADAKMEVDAPNKKQIPALGVLEEDDEFEEFPAQDWEDRDTDIANLTNPSASGASKNTVDNLWEDNWDDDDVEDDFSKQLRQVLFFSSFSTLLT
ncbi:DSS1/SEM1 family domain-containing protein [Ceratobasidium sp. AG-Ba]|nr:DSS1/SEM1 family domain-containing protein [Ceratobasidium sp. AG-Ba]